MVRFFSHAQSADDLIIESRQKKRKVAEAAEYCRGAVLLCANCSRQRSMFFHADNKRAGRKINKTAFFNIFLLPIPKNGKNQHHRGSPHSIVVAQGAYTKHFRGNLWHRS